MSGIEGGEGSVVGDEVREVIQGKPAHVSMIKTQDLIWGLVSSPWKILHRRRTCFKRISGCYVDTRSERAGVEAGDQLGGSCPKKRQW